MDTVFKVCGVKKFSELPPSVRAVMNEGDYDGNGHPLSVRRIRAVTQAIQIAEVEEAVNKTVSLEDAGKMVDGALVYINGKGKNHDVGDAELDAGKRQMATSLVARFGAGMTDANLRIFANYVVLAVACGSCDNERIQAVARRMSKELKDVRNFSPGDPRLAAFDEVLKGYYQSVVEHQLDAENARKFDKDGRYTLFNGDINRASFRIAGESFLRTAITPPQTVQKKLDDAVPNVTHRKILTTFMCQEAGTIFQQLSGRGPLLSTPEYENFDMRSAPGRNLVFGIDKDDSLFDGLSPLQGADELMYTLDVHDDGKKAKITVQNTGNILFRISDTDACTQNPTGRYTYSLEFEFDLSDPNGATVTSVHFGQELGVPEP